MTITYAENEKRHILESSNGYVATYLKSQLTKEEAEQAFKLSLKTLPTGELVEEDEEIKQDYTEFTDVQEEVEEKVEDGEE